MFIKVDDDNKKTYVHYATFQKDSNKFKFDKKYFDKIINRNFISKPKGGFWASPVNAKRGWEKWCADEEPEWIENVPSYTFTLKNNSNILYLKNILEIKDLLENYSEYFLNIEFPEYFCKGVNLSPNHFKNAFLRFLENYNFSKYEGSCYCPTVCFDFEKMLADGIDAVEIEIDELYYALYGWDCDSILIMNPDIVVV